MRSWREGIQVIELAEAGFADASGPENLEAPERAIGVGDGIHPDRLLALALHGDFRHLVQRSNPALETDLLTSALMLRRPEIFLGCPVSSILDPERAGASREGELLHFEAAVPELAAKQPAVDSLGRFVDSFPASRRFRYDCILAADELCSNAILSAPTRRRTAEERPEPDPGEPPRPARLFAGSAGARLIIGCADGYGSLKIAPMLSRMRDCFECGAARMINYGRGGAGIGAFLVFDSCTSLYIAVNPGIRTVICCDFPLQPLGMRARRAIPKNLHLLSN